MNFRCPVCFFNSLPYPPRDYHICPCCGTEFGNDDADFSHAELRRRWIANGAPWFYENPPERWNPWIQLINAGVEYDLPFRVQMQPYQPVGVHGEINIQRGTVQTVTFA